MTPPAPDPDHTILLVEDDRGIRIISSRILKRAGYKVFSAIDAEEALELADGLNEGIDLLITDLTLPGQDGFQLAEAITAAHPSTKVIFMSGLVRDVVERTHGAVSSATFLPKPFTHQEILDHVQAVMGA